MSAGARHSAEVHVGGGCELSCTVCDCRHSPTEEERLARIFAQGGARITLRGGTADSERVEALVQRARETGFTEIALRTSALPYATAARAHALAQSGVHTAIVPLHAHARAVHDRIAATPGALVAALVGLRALAEAGIGVEVEIPILPAALQDLTQVVELAHRAVPGLRAVRFHLPRDPQPAVLAPPSWDEGAERLARALARCKQLGVKAELRPSDAIPLCAAHGRTEILEALRFHPHRPAPQLGGMTHPPACERCAVRAQCVGVTPSYLAAHGARGLAPFERRPRALYQQRTTRRREWNEAQKQSARSTRLLVLRPTVNCNQDCRFCSANETARDVWPDPTALLRQIARAARRGVTRVSFSGGEPTLSPHLPRFVEAARRLGVPEVDVCTNATLLAQPARVKALRQAGLTHAFVSLHAHDEQLSRLATQKEGDFAKTVAGIHGLLAAGVDVTVNHVVHATNQRYLTRFVEFIHQEFAGRVLISFAFVTPQYKALDHLELVPRLSDVMPQLRRACRRALALGQPFYVGAQQGVPPCFLGEFRAWSDALGVAPDVLAHDTAEKQRSPACDSCRYTKHCAGLWKPYVARYGLGELRPVVGPAYTPEEVALGPRDATAAGFPRNFEEVPELFRDRAAEAEQPSAPEAPTSLALPVLAPARTRPLRVVLLGSGRRARRLAGVLRSLPGLSLDAVSSPHAPDGDLQEFGSIPAFREAAEALDTMRPDLAIVAAATQAHRALAERALATGIPTLIEKPVAETVADAEALRALAAEHGTLAMPAHNLLFAPGLDELWTDGEVRRVQCVFRVRAASSDAPPTWERAALYEPLYHLASVARRALGDRLGSVRRALWRGDERPRFVRLELDAAELVLDLEAASDELTVTSEARHVTTWRRAGSQITLVREGIARPFERQGGELERMLSHVRDVVRDGIQPAVTLDDALAIKRLLVEALAMLEAEGAPFARPHAPKHVASPGLRVRLG